MLIKYPQGANGLMTDTVENIWKVVPESQEQCSKSTGSSITSLGQSKKASQRKFSNTNKTDFVFGQRKEREQMAEPNTAEVRIPYLKETLWSEKGSARGKHCAGLFQVLFFLIMHSNISYIGTLSLAITHIPF